MNTDSNSTARRQEIAAVRQASVSASGSGSSAVAATKTTTTPTSASPFTASTGSAASSSSAQADPAAATMTPAIAADLADVLGNRAVSAGASATLAGLLRQNAPPSAYAAPMQPSTDPNVYMGGSYQQEMNLNFFYQQANHENINRYDGYKTSLSNWVVNGMQGQPPAAPQYESVDLAGFTKWWGQFCSSNTGAPPVTFVSNLGFGGPGAGMS